MSNGQIDADTHMTVVQAVIDQLQRMDKLSQLVDKRYCEELIQIQFDAKMAMLSIEKRLREWAKKEIYERYPVQYEAPDPAVLKVRELIRTADAPPSDDAPPAKEEKANDKKPAK